MASGEQGSLVMMQPVVRPSVPAWLLSGGLHVIAMVVLAIALHPQPPLTPPNKRPVGIVLARQAEDVRYFDEETNAADQSVSTPETTSSSAQSSAPAPFPPATNQMQGVDSPELPGQQEVADHGSGLLEGLVTSGGGRAQILPGLGDEEILANDPLRNRPVKNLGPAAAIRLFGTRAEGRSFVFLIDRSKSMGGEGLGAIEAAERELIASLTALAPAQKFQIVAYNQRLSANEPKMIPASAENKTKAAKFLGGIVAHGQTEHYMAVAAALRGGPEVIYVMTDGGDPHLSDPQIRQLTLRAKGKTTIHCIQFGFGPPQEEDGFLKRLARLNGGGYAYIDMLRGSSQKN